MSDFLAFLSLNNRLFLNHSPLLSPPPTPQLYHLLCLRGLVIQGQDGR